uniref:Minor capsid protein P11 C-terminal conserved region domain-containing protein n=1 Tax=viral metagenome TaxID=1070528 RepID=A0A6C0ECN3_9ZZZZ
MGSNQISNLIILLLVGFLIYYLTRPSNINENFSDPSIPTAKNGASHDTTLMSSAMPNEMAALMQPAYANATNIVNTSDPTNTTKKKVSSDASNANITQDMLNQIIAETETNTGNPKDIFNFKPNLDTNDMGAELSAAFDKADVPLLTPETVNVNKNNVSQYNAKDFLPKEINDQWFDTDFSQAKFNINDDKLINTEKYIIGINTVGQSLKNASYDIRGAIPNPKYSVSPWNNSTIEADYNIKSLC